MGFINNKRISLTIWSGIICLFILYACKDKKDDSVLRTVTLYGQVKHHAETIGSAEVYLKFRTSIFPGRNPSDYDLMIQADANARFKINDVPFGTHFIYARGFDEGINDSVSGGIPIVISPTQEEAIVEVPVSE